MLSGKTKYKIAMFLVFVIAAVIEVHYSTKEYLERRGKFLAANINSRIQVIGKAYKGEILLKVDGDTILWFIL